MKYIFNYYKDSLFALFISIICIIALYIQSDKIILSHPEFQNLGDAFSYREMALNNTFEYYHAPYCWRILNPLLAKIMPFDLHTNFILLSIISLTLAGFFSYLIFRRIGISNTLSITGLLFFMAIGWAVRFNIEVFWNTDALSYLFLTIIIWSIFTKKDIFYVILLIIGITVKESIIFASPLYYTLNTNTLKNSKLLIRTIYLTIPSLILLIVLRIIIPAENNYNLSLLLNNISFIRLKELFSINIFLYTITTFGVSLIFLCFFSIKTNLYVLLKFSPYILLTYLSLFFALNTERLIVFAFPAVIIMALYGISNIVEKTGINERYYVFLPTILLVLLLFKQDWHVVNFLVESFILISFLAISIQAKRINIPNKVVNNITKYDTEDCTNLSLK